MQRNQLNQVPDEILIEIFIYMTDSLKTVMITLPCVCERFYKLIDPPKMEKYDELLSDQLNKLNIRDRNDESDMMNDGLYEYLLRSYSLNSNFVSEEILNRFKSFRTAFVNSGTMGLAIPLEKCFRREMCYKEMTLFESEDLYRMKPTYNADHDDELTSSSSANGRTVRMNKDYKSSNAGMCIVNNPIYYDSGIHFFEFRIHKSGTYDNLLMGLVLTDVLSECKVENPMDYDRLSERFEIKTKSLDVPFLDYVGSGNSLGIGYYDEGYHIYLRNTSIKTYDFSTSNQNILTYPCDTTGCQYIIGVYFDSKNFRLAFSRNGIFIKQQLEISELIQNRYADYLSGNLAFYPAVSLGQLDDAVTFESRVPYEKIQILRKISTELSFLPYNSDDLF